VLAPFKNCPENVKNVAKDLYYIISIAAGP